MRGREVSPKMREGKELIGTIVCSRESIAIRRAIYGSVVL